MTNPSPSDPGDPKQKPLTVAVVQLSCGQDRDANLSRARSLMEEGVRKGADLIALPENLTFIGSEGDKLALAEDPEKGPTARLLSAFAREHSVAIVGGTFPLKTADQKKVTNSCFVFDRSGSVLARYDKIHLFDVCVDSENTFQESRYVQSGAEPVTFELSGITMGISICYDLRFPELYRSLALRGAQVLFVPSAFTRETGRDHWEILLRARAVENLCYVVAPAQWGVHGAGRVSYGRSMVVGPWGQILAQAADSEGVVTAQLDIGAVKEARRRLPGLDHVRLDRIRTVEGN